MLAKETNAGAVASVINTNEIKMGPGSSSERIFYDGIGIGFNATNGFGFSLELHNAPPSQGNYEMLWISSAGPFYVITSYGMGTGTARPLRIQGWDFGTPAASNMLPLTTNAFDIGSVTKYVRNIFTTAISWMTRAAPASPADGDMWFDGTALKIQIGGATKTVTVT
jgi:hypothetical protein